MMKKLMDERAGVLTNEDHVGLDASFRALLERNQPAN